MNNDMYKRSFILCAEYRAGYTKLGFSMLN
jgi:hypothetical protein